MNKLYSVHDHWTDINKKNDVDIESIDGVITRIKVNGEDYGGGGGETWQTVFEGSVTTTDPLSTGFSSGTVEGIESLTADTIKVTFNGTEYTCENNNGEYGAPYNKGSYDFTEFPFNLGAEGGTVYLTTKTPNTYSLKIEEPATAL